MIGSLNHLIDHVEEQLARGADAEIDVEALARGHTTTGYHLRRMFSSLAGMPLSEYLRRRRMTRAAADLLSGTDTLLDVAVRHGYSSTEAFNRAFHAVHGMSPAQLRANGGPISNQHVVRFRLTVEGSTPMDVRITTCPEIYFAGYATRVPLLYEGANPHIINHITSLDEQQHGLLRTLAEHSPEGTPPGVVGVTDSEPDAAEGSGLTYLHGVSVTETTDLPESLDVITVPAGDWVIFRTSGPHPETVQAAWAATASDWFPSNPWRLRPGPSTLATLDHNADFSEATCEIWMPVEADR